ncbi:scarecrow-like protein 18 [Cannabis sativa]|uniref:scarecrow-like protein 18 n=1 Tax=Cannabis sativa TaxID=3483 RepID=UPI0029CA951B|nr:scarecrow-like protein 18 [Cannabis sativa]
MLMGSFNSSSHHQYPQPQPNEDNTSTTNTNTITTTTTASSDLVVVHDDDIDELGLGINNPLQPQPPQQQQQQPQYPIINNPIQMRQLVTRCADLISHSDLTAAHRLISILSANSSPYGDSMERLLHQLSKALLHQIQIIQNQNPIDHYYDLEALHSSYLTLNQITPFIRFCHLTANQAILEVIDHTQHHSLHIIDFDIMHGLQWPPFMQALSERHPMLRLRITATGTDLSLLRRTGDRLLRFAQSLGLHFQFQPFLLPRNHPPHLIINALISSGGTSSSRAKDDDEALAVNCVLYLQRVVAKEEVEMFLNSIKGVLNPTVVTIAERCISRYYLDGALEHYSAIFESLEATLPPNSRERVEVEQVWLGREIMEVMKMMRNGSSNNENEINIEDEDHDHVVNNNNYDVVIGRCGFENVALSPFAVSQAKLLLRLHYPSEGYHLHILNNSLFLSWQNRPLFSVSSWH